MQNSVRLSLIIKTKLRIITNVYTYIGTGHFYAKVNDRRGHPTICVYAVSARLHSSRLHFVLRKAVFKYIDHVTLCYRIV